MIAEMDCRRNRIARRLANVALRLATSEYRAMIDGAVRYGLKSAELDARGDYWIFEQDGELRREHRPATSAQERDS